MNKPKTAILLTAIIIFSIIISGCTDSDSPIQVFLPPNLDSKPQQTEVNENRFVEKRKSATALESAVELSEKYAVLSAEASELKMQNKVLQNEKEYLIKELNASKSQNQQAQKELAEANNLLLDTRVEMNNWKSDILGFREEMRQAEIAQLQSLKQILEVLGGETPPQVAAEGQ